MIKQQTNQQKQYNMQAVVNQPQKPSPPTNRKRSSGDDRLIRPAAAAAAAASTNAAQPQQASASRQPAIAPTHQQQQQQSTQQPPRLSKKSSMMTVVNDPQQLDGERDDAGLAPPLSQGQKLNNRLMHFRIVRSFQQDSKTVFEMQVAPHSDLGTPWMVYHRFNEFRTLHMQLAAHFETHQSTSPEAAAAATVAKQYKASAGFNKSDKQQKADKNTRQTTSHKAEKKSKKVAADSSSNIADKSHSSSFSDASSVYQRTTTASQKGTNQFVLPKFQGKVKALFGGIFSIEKRTKFLQEYMNGLINQNDAPSIKVLFTSCTLFEDFIGLINRGETKRKLLKRMSEEEQQATTSQSTHTIRKSQSSNQLNVPPDVNEESKRVPGSKFSAEAPPKDNNERVERLLTKLDNASQMSDIEQQSRELRYLDEFDLISASYNDDQIKRTFLGNGLNQKGLLQQIQNPRLASPTLKLLARIFNQEKNIGYRSFEKVIHKVPKAHLVSCNFGQFFGNGNLAEEKSVILIIDCYNRRQQPANQMRQNKAVPNDEQPPINVFNEDRDYEYFCQIYKRWKDRRERTAGVLEPAETKSKPIRKNDSFSSFSSQTPAIPKNRSGFFVRNTNTLDMSGHNNTSFQSDCLSPDKPKTRKKTGGQLTGGQQFKQTNDDLRCSSSSDSSSSDGDSSNSSSSEDYFDNDGTADPEVDAISEGHDETVEESKDIQIQRQDTSHDESSGGEKFVPRRNKKQTPLKKPSRKIDLVSLLLQDNKGMSKRVRSNSLNANLVVGEESKATNDESQNNLHSIQEQDDNQADPSRMTEKPRKMTQDTISQDFDHTNLDYMSEEDRLGRLKVPNNITTSSQQSSHSTSCNNKKFKAPLDLDEQVMSWINEYRHRESVLFEELLYQSPQFVLGQLATVILKKNNTKRLSRLGRQVPNSKDNISLCNLVSYIEENLSSEMINVRGVQVQLIQTLSQNQKIIEIETSSDTPSFKSLSAQNLTTPLNSNSSGFSQPQASFLKQKQEVKPKTRKKVKHRFLLSYLKSEQEGFISLFLVNDRASCINTDIVVILSQPLSNDAKLARSLPVVPEMSGMEDLGDASPASILKAKNTAATFTTGSKFFPTNFTTTSQSAASGVGGVVGVGRGPVGQVDFAAQQNAAAVQRQQLQQQNQPQQVLSGHFEELYKSHRIAAEGDSYRIGPFGALAANEMEREIVEPKQDNNSAKTAQLRGDTYGKLPQLSTTTSSNSNQREVVQQIQLMTLAAGGQGSNSTDVLESSSSAGKQLFPACAGEITLKVQVKYHKNFLKLLKQLLQTVVLEQHLY